MIGKELGNVSIEHKAVTRTDGRLDPIVYTAWGGLPRQAPPRTIELQSEKYTSFGYNEVLKHT